MDTVDSSLSYLRDQLDKLRDVELAAREVVATWDVQNVAPGAMISAYMVMTMVRLRKALDRVEPHE